MAQKLNKKKEAEDMLNKAIGFDGISSALKYLDSFYSDEPYMWEKTEEKKIRRFESGAVRSDDTGRIRPDYISPYAIEEIAEHFTTAKNDFGPTNYFLGIKPKDIIPSVYRHYLDLHKAYLEGDKEQIRHDFRSLAANCIMALHQIVLEEKGLYNEKYDKPDLVNAGEYLKQMEG